MMELKLRERPNASENMALIVAIKKRIITLSASKCAFLLMVLHCLGGV